MKHLSVFLHRGGAAALSPPPECAKRNSDEMARDEARHGKAFAGLLNRYFGE